MTRQPAGSLVWLQGLCCGALITFATPSAILIGVMMAPAIVAMVADREPGRPVARAMALAGAAATLGPLWHLWLLGDTLTTALDLVSEPATLVGGWLAGAAAWAVCQVLPVIIIAVWEAQVSHRIRGLEAETAELAEAWEL